MKPTNILMACAILCTGTILAEARPDLVAKVARGELKEARASWWGFDKADATKFLQAAITESQKNVTGDVRCKLYKGNCFIVGRRSPYTLYDPQVVTFEADDVYNQQDATGFIKLNALRLRINANAKKPQD